MAVGHSFCMSKPRSGTLNGFLIGGTVAAIAYGVLLVMLAVVLGHGPDILFTLFEGLLFCLIGGAIGAGVGTLVQKGGRR